MSLRDDKKKRIKEKILEVSNELFLNSGYENTTTDEIAAKAGIGAGTLYNYFGSKADIFLEVFTEQQVKMMEEPINLVADNVQGAVEIIMQHVMKHVGIIRYFPKPIIRDLTVASFGLFKKNPDLFRKMMDMDYKIMCKISVMLEQMKKKKLIRQELDIKESVELMYGAMTYEFMLYLFEEGFTLENTIEGIKRKIQMILR